MLFLQTGSGHFSPIGGYHTESDMVLILDVARFKYPPHWVPLSLLWEAMNTVVEVTGRHRGYAYIIIVKSECTQLKTLFLPIICLTSICYNSFCYCMIAIELSQCIVKWTLCCFWLKQIVKLLLLSGSCLCLGGRDHQLCFITWYDLCHLFFITSLFFFFVIGSGALTV